MGLAVFILGYSGSGKSTSLRNFGADELAVVNVNGKPMPFRTRFNHTLNSDDYNIITDFIGTTKCKSIAVDDTQYLMVNEFMRRAAETGFQKFTDIGKNMWSLVKLVETLPEDKIVYFLSHIEADDTGRQKFKTIGKLLDEKINLEGMVSIVLKTVVVDGKYLFATQTDGTDTSKSPMGLFSSMYIPNDTKLVDDAIRLYYGFAPATKCEDCGEDILPGYNMSADKIIEKAVTTYGKKLCLNCCKKHKEQKKCS